MQMLMERSILQEIEEEKNDRRSEGRWFGMSSFEKAPKDLFFFSTFWPKHQVLFLFYFSLVSSLYFWPY